MTTPPVKTIADVQPGDRIKIAVYARWLKVVYKLPDGSAHCVHQGTHFNLRPDYPIAKHEAA